MNMGKKINKPDFKKWFSEYCVEYASVNAVDDSGYLKRLRILVYLDGTFKVTLGSNIVYSGEDITDAFYSYNSLL